MSPSYLEVYHLDYFRKCSPTDRSLGVLFTELIYCFPASSLLLRLGNCSPSVFIWASSNTLNAPQGEEEASGGSLEKLWGLLQDGNTPLTERIYWLVSWSNGRVNGWAVRKNTCWMAWWHPSIYIYLKYCNIFKLFLNNEFRRHSVGLTDDTNGQK